MSEKYIYINGAICAKWLCWDSTEGNPNFSWRQVRDEICSSYGISVKMSLHWVKNAMFWTHVHCFLYVVINGKGKSGAWMLKVCNYLCVRCELCLDIIPRETRRHRWTMGNCTGGNANDRTQANENRQVMKQAHLIVLKRQKSDAN